jgi:hypothetical protein
MLAYCATLNNYTLEDVAHGRCTSYAEFKLNYIIVGHEVGEQGTLHIQIYIQLASQAKIIWDMSQISKYIRMLHVSRCAALTWQIPLVTMSSRVDELGVAHSSLLKLRWHKRGGHHHKQGRRALWIRDGYSYRAFCRVLVHDRSSRHHGSCGC